MTVKYSNWYGLYQESWGDIISPESFSHPAKYARGLITRIYEYAIEQGYAIPGQTVVIDPFAGVSCGAWGALQNNLTWIGIELEPFFVDIGRGCDCTGVSKTDYAKLFTRAKKLAYKGGRHLCPQCQSELGRITQPVKSEAIEIRQNTLRQKFQKYRAKLNHYKALAVREYYARKGFGKPSRLALKREPMIVDPLPFTQKPQPKQHGLFEIVPPDTLAYERNSGRIPVRLPHHYKGNVERWLEIWPGQAWCLQGDSTKLAGIIAKAGLAINQTDNIEWCTCETENKTV